MAMLQKADYRNYLPHLAQEEYTVAHLASIRRYLQGLLRESRPA